MLIAEGAAARGAWRRRTLKDGGAQVYLLGTELWSGEAARREQRRRCAARWFSAVSDNRYRQFADSYETRFGEQPYRIATLGYDAVLLTLRIARDWQPGRAFPTGRMLAADGFLGLDGAVPLPQQRRRRAGDGSARGRQRHGQRGRPGADAVLTGPISSAMA